ncbi:hypothetical protein GDO81_020782 [Engystomops pustulosus]|uniref:Uncharacterized protein n=1 Tax=Engystomops pustulosus TaxID=76066 RepID=A0AAV6ZDJ1_ENGPU|nr:hypothetical protein GDO81_020782 [Engystomops pustulosus]
MLDPLKMHKCSSPGPLPPGKNRLDTKKCLSLRLSQTELQQWSQRAPSPAAGGESSRGGEEAGGSRDTQLSTEYSACRSCAGCSPSMRLPLPAPPARR